LPQWLTGAVAAEAKMAVGRLVLPSSKTVIGGRSGQAVERVKLTSVEHESCNTCPLAPAVKVPSSNPRGIGVVTLEGAPPATACCYLQLLLIKPTKGLE
jgi:hypothetical protein